MMRVRGAVLIVLGGAISAFGTWLLYLTMAWVFPAFVPRDLVPQGVTLNLQGPPLTSLPGLVALFLIGFGGVFALLGLGMLVTGRRNRMLYSIALAFAVIYAAGIAMVVLSPGS